MSIARAELRDVDMQRIVDKCISDIMIEGVSRDQAFQQGALRAQMAIPLFKQCVMTRVEMLLKH